MAVASNLPQNINILETFDDNEPLRFGGYPNSKFSFDYILFINQLGKK